MDSPALAPRFYKWPVSPALTFGMNLSDRPYPPKFINWRTWSIFTSSRVHCKEPSQLPLDNLPDLPVWMFVSRFLSFILCHCCNHVTCTIAQRRFPLCSHKQFAKAFSTSTHSNPYSKNHCGSKSLVLHNSSMVWTNDQFGNPLSRYVIKQGRSLPFWRNLSHFFFVLEIRQHLRAWTGQFRRKLQTWQGWRLSTFDTIH